MTSGEGPTLWGWRLPEPGPVFWGTIIGSIALFLFLGRSAANIYAIVGAVLLTVILYKRERSERNDSIE